MKISSRISAIAFAILLVNVFSANANTPEQEQPYWDIRIGTGFGTTYAGLGACLDVGLGRASEKAPIVSFTLGVSFVPIPVLDADKQPHEPLDEVRYMSLGFKLYGENRNARALGESAYLQGYTQLLYLTPHIETSQFGDVYALSTGYSLTSFNHGLFLNISVALFYEQNLGLFLLPEVGIGLRF